MRYASRMSRPRIDFASGAFYGDGAREAYAWLRKHSPVHRDEGSGLWGVATYDAVVQVGRDWATFSNASGSRPGTGPLPWMIDMDPPLHQKRRTLVSGGFTPGRVRAGAAAIEQLCDELLDAVCEQEGCDLVRDLAAPLPLIVIADMLGVAPADRQQLLRWSDDLLSSLAGGDDAMQRAAEAFVGYSDYAKHVITARREHPTDDLVSVLVHAEVEGTRLTDDEIVFESLLLLVGGDETTRHVISGGIEQLLEHRGARELFRNVPRARPAAVEEMLRWVSPIKTMNRTATTDVQLCDQQLHEGDQLVLLYESADFDERHFDEPERFDVGRTVRDHVAFGVGPHVCLGASLARLEVTSMVTRVLERLPDLRRADDAPLPRSMGAIQAMPVRFSPTAPVGRG